MELQSENVCGDEATDGQTWITCQPLQFGLDMSAQVEHENVRRPLRWNDIAWGSATWSRSQDDIEEEKVGDDWLPNKQSWGSSSHLADDVNNNSDVNNNGEEAEPNSCAVVVPAIMNMFMGWVTVWPDASGIWDHTMPSSWLPRQSITRGR